MRLRIIQIITLAFLSNCIFSQVKKESYLFKTLYLDVGYFYLCDSYNQENRKLYFHEHNFFGTFGISISKTVFAGIKVNPILTHRQYPNKHHNWYFIIDGFCDYYFINRKYVKMYLEGSFGESDFNCFHKNLDEPTREKGILYAGFGMGIKWNVWQNKLFINMIFMYQTIVNKSEQIKQWGLSSGCHNTFKLGLSYYIGKELYIKKSKNEAKR